MSETDRTGEADVEEIDVPEVPEPDEPDLGVFDPDDTYTEGDPDDA